MTTRPDLEPRTLGRLLAIAAVCAALAAGIVGPAPAAAASWAIEPTPTSRLEHGDLAGVACTSLTTCTAVGSSFGADPDVRAPLMERWSDGAWSIQPMSPTPKHGQLWGVSCVSDVACTAVGQVDTSGGDTFPLAERWNGTSWSVQRAPAPFFEGSPDDAALFGVSCASKTACTAVGQDEISSEPLVERWNGSKWSIERTPRPSVDGGGLTGVSCASRTRCVGVGTYADDSTECSVPLVENWNGRGWSIQRAAELPPCGAANDSGFEGISCASATTCTAVGAYDHANAAYDHPLAERRLAGVWSLQPSPKVNYLVDPWGGGGYLDDVSCTSPVACVAVGTAGSELRDIPIIERWAGVRWDLERTAGGVLDGELLSVSCTSDTTCTAVGYNDGTGPDVPLVERLS